ncbi:MAG: hypothetical protein HZB87_06195 [Desulfatitalea sp.]|nr:hypothetical protein [Desulfatitalea sp.]MBI5896505.1 hypothetical protein [Desulfobacterales bacterium]
MRLPGFEAILAQDALAFVADLQRRFDDRHLELPRNEIFVQAQQALEVMDRI